MSKNFKQKIFGSKRVRSKKVVVQKNVVPKIKVQKNFGSNKIFDPEILGPRKFWVQKMSNDFHNNVLGL